jgi:hypothetical protein
MLTRTKRNADAVAAEEKGRLPGDPNGHDVVVRIFNKEATTGFTLRSVNVSDAGHWQLIARHRTGSLDGFIASTRRRRRHFGVLLLLAAAWAWEFTARRSQRLAHRQLEFVSSVLTSSAPRWR